MKKRPHKIRQWGYAPTQNHHRLLTGLLVLALILLSVTVSFAAPISYEYDDLNRLIRATGNRVSVGYVYDLVGNLLQKNISSASATITSGDFGQGAVGYTSAPQTITYTNTGSATIAIGTVTISGTDAASFSILSDTCSGQTLASSKDCAVGVVFSPSTTGAEAGSISIGGNGMSILTYAFPLTGEGVISQISVSPTSYDYGSVDIGSTATQTFIVSNTGTASISLGSLSITGKDAAEFQIASNDECDGKTLSPSDSCTFQVLFAPMTGGGKNANVAVATDAPGVPALNLSLDGSGKNPQLSVTKSGTGNGSITSSPSGLDCGAACSYSFAYNSLVTLTATADSCSTFANWSGCDTVNSNDCTVSMSSQRSVTIDFASTVALNPGTQSFTYEGGTGTLNVISPQGDCAWTAESNVPWIMITSGGSGSGNAAVDYRVDKSTNIIVPRTGTITAAGQIFTVHQTTVTGAGGLDTTFNSPQGFVTYDLSGNSSGSASSVAIQPDGKIVVVGSGYDGTNNSVLVVRYNADGTLDNGFGTNGAVTYSGQGSDFGNAVAIQSDGKIVVAGTSYGSTDSVVLAIRLNVDGTLDNTFGVNGVATYSDNGWDMGTSTAIQTDGKIEVDPNGWTVLGLN